MKSMTKNYVIALVVGVFITMFSMNSCKQTMEIDLEINSNITVANSEFQITNKRTDKVYRIYGHSSDTIIAQSGDEMRIQFVPTKKLEEEYTFYTTYLFPNGTDVEDQREYEFSVSEDYVGTIYLSAQALENDSIRSEASFYLKIEE